MRAGQTFRRRVHADRALRIGRRRGHRFQRLVHVLHVPGRGKLEPTDGRHHFAVLDLNRGQQVRASRHLTGTATVATVATVRCTEAKLELVLFQLDRRQ